MKCQMCEVDQGEKFRSRKRITMWVEKKSKIIVLWKNELQ